MSHAPVASRLRPSSLSHAFYFLTAASALAAALFSTVTSPERLLLVAAPFAIVLVHELGHACVAWLTGRRVMRMVVWPWSGLTLVAPARSTELSWIAVAAAGPVLSALFALVAVFALRAEAVSSSVALSTWLQVVLLVSLVESAANLLPFGEFDGARIRNTLRLRRAARRACADERVVVDSGRLPALGGSPVSENVDWALSFLNVSMEERVEETTPRERER